MESRTNGYGPPRGALKRLMLAAFLVATAIACAAVILAPSLGLGEKYDFVLYRWLGMPRSLALQLLLWPAFLLLAYLLLGVGIETPGDRSRFLHVLRSAWRDGTTIARRLANSAEAGALAGDRRLAALLIVAFVVLFAVFLSKTLAWFTFPVDQRWWQAMMSYGIDWRAPVFSFGGNLLYDFGIQVPLKGQLLPLEGTAHWFAAEHRIPATVTLCFLATAILFWCIGAVMGLGLVYRTVFAGLVALITTIPSGLDYVIWFLPPRFFTHQFALALWWGEAPILFLTGAFLFLLIGRQRSIAANLLAGIGFAMGAFAAVLSYAVGAVFFVPLMALYCLGFVLTCESRHELFWKAGVSAAVAAFMIIARVPQFLSNLYSYSFGGYFFEFSADAPPSFKSNFLFASHIDDPRALFVFVVAFVALAIAAASARGLLRRFAIAALVCEGGIVAITTVNLWVWKVPLAGAYAELGHAPMWGSFFVLAMIVAGMLFDRRVASAALAGARYPTVAQRAARHRHWIYAAFLIAMIAVFWRSQPPLWEFPDRNYPPERTPSVELLTREIALAPGAQFRGRLMTVVPADLSGPSDLFTFTDVTMNRYRRYLGNDHYIDAATFDIPTVNEYGYWAAPTTFAFYRIFFGREGEGFGRAWFVLSRFDLRIARLVGVRMVATDAADIPGGTLVYEARAGDTDLRLFRIDGTNLGQYSPTIVRRVGTAADAIAVLKSPDFDPVRDVVVEDDMPPELLAATSSVVTVDRGPKLVVRATSPGRSLLVLPFEYSNCLRIKATAGQVRLLPVNLQQTGLLFEKEVDAEITYQFGLFRDSGCRGEDHKRADGLQLKEALISNDRATATKKRPASW